VGTSIATEEEYQRAGVRSVVSANQKRIEQALRCLEEYGKLLSAEFAARVESLRYRAYTLCRALEITANSRERLASVRLYVLIDGRRTPQAFAELVDTLTRAGVDALQLRDKKLDDRELLSRARVLRRLTRSRNVLMVMNDRPDLAVLADADGVHLGQEDLAVKDARRILGPDRLIGVSTHGLDQARQAVLDGANYLGCGPTFPSQTKEFASFAGLDYLRQVRSEISLPAFAIGGVTLERMDEVLETGFKRVAISAAVSGADSPGDEAARFTARLKTNCEA
jgi:thiamine-phosphate pyrophosphorylase